MGMNVRINNQPFELPAGATLADAVTLFRAVAPFAAAVNMQFVPQSLYATTALKNDDSIEIIRPVTGG